VSSEPGKQSATILRRMYTALLGAYGPQHWWPATTSLEVIVEAYLTQNTSWRAVQKSIENLRTLGIINLTSLRAISEEELRSLIKPSGFMQRKASSIKAFIQFLDREYDGSLKRLSSQDTTKARRQLLALPGVGPETADAILLYALGHPAMVVDEYLRRLVSRHNLAHEKASYAEIQQLALRAFTEDESSRAQHYNEFHALVVELGKQHCRRYPQCDGCPLSKPDFHPPRLTGGEAKQRRKAAAKM
jgi:endonuclease-3 related protein